ncbi:hypothetical protein [Pelagicoccus sp. SDUM812003]|uniref:hypothetical protein n=1 Tax=Pelagicoccus sp. SDUM812003 TaxID=3041267 RepID=UPI00280E2FFF|nr:hypothetical protein [Pelagicoccus sp. SDUM812003]MDQ8205327.1 hypothetical protein [Pelagicoccus sp. SDUM812003]
MKVHTIEIAAAIESELKKFIDDWGGGYPMRFTRFVDLGGKQTDLYVYKAEKDTPPWMIVRIKAVMKSEQGECIQYFVNIVGSDKRMEEVVVSPEIWKLPALADKVLNFSRDTLLLKINEGGGAIEGGGPSLEGGSARSEPPPSSKSDSEPQSEDDDYEDIDTSGILAGDDDSEADMGFNPEDVFAQANAGGDDDVDPSELIRQMNEEESEEDEEEK